MEVKTIAILGAGQMGTGIAQVAATAGFNVIMHDVKADAIERATGNIKASLGRIIEKGRITVSDREKALARIEAAPDVAGIGSADFIIEAAVENLEAKWSLLQRVDRVRKPGSIVATNTSSVSITKLSGALADPTSFIGMHFFNPVPAMALVEIIRGFRTTSYVESVTEKLATQLGKTPVFVKNSPGFVVNRLLIPLINEAANVLQEGVATREDIDAAMKLGANHPIGPLALADLIGLDTCLAIMNVLQRDFADQKYRPATLLCEMVDAGMLGRKTRQGFYEYE